MLKRKKYILGLLTIVLSISVANYKVVLAANNSVSINESSYNDAEKTGKDENNSLWSYMLHDDGTVTIGQNIYNNTLKGEIEIPEKVDGYTVSVIGDFSNCGRITSVKIPNTVKIISNSAFSGCTNLSNIEIPSSVSDIGAFAFENTPWLTNKRNSDSLVIVNNILIDGRSAAGNIVIPFGVKKIGEAAFTGCSLGSISIPVTVDYIGLGALYSYKGDSIYIPNKAVEIRERAFAPNVKINIGSETVQYGWNKYSDHWYWLWSDGTKRTGWYAENGEWYYFYGNGEMAAEFIDLGGGYSYYLKPNSMDGKATMVTGWKYINGDWFYFNTNSDGYKGAMKRACWAYIGGKWYYFYYDGTMAHNTYIDGYYVDSSGAWV